MKSTKRFISLTVLFFILIAGLTSCGNLFMKNTGTGTQPTPADDVKPATGGICGSVTTEGALSSQLAGIVSSSRTADPDGDFTSGYTFTAIATPESGERITQEFEGTSFTIEGLAFGKAYSISVEVSKGDSVVLSGTSGTPVTLSLSTPSASIGQIALTAIAGGKGYIRLPIHCDDTSVTEVTVWIDNGEVNKTFFFDNGDTTIEFTGTSSGDTEGLTASSMTMEFYKTVSYNGGERKILAYQCKEAVNVFENLTTDTWVKNGQEPYLTTENGKVVFKLTTSCITNFELNTFYVDPKDDGRNNGSPFDPFTTLEQAVLAIKGSNSPAPKTILIKAGTTVSEPGATLTVMESKGALSIGVYGAEGGTTTATVKKTRNSTFATVVQNASFSVSDINFINTDGISLTTCATWVEIQSGATGTFENCTFSGSTGNNSIYTAAENTTVKNCTFQGDANSVYCSAGSRLHLNGDAHHFTDGSEIVLDSTDTTLAGIYIDSDFNANSHSEETIPVRFITPSRYVNNNVFFQYISGNVTAFTVTNPDFDNYIINGSGKLVTPVASGSISTPPAVFDDLTVTLTVQLADDETQVEPTFRDNSSDDTTIALTDLSSISCEVTYYGDVVPAGYYSVSADYHITLYPSLPDGPYTITIYFTYNGKAYQASFPVTKEGDNVTL